ncbi:MAG TPA: hypothetical protein P5167_06010 [Bacteroidales bacterium]|nr:hypothetical protein [Bacteroidales bacterium]
MRWLLAGLLLLTLSACSNKINEELLYGTWIMESIDGQDIHTNDFFVLRFNPDGTEMHASPLYQDSVNVRWFHGEDYTYKFLTDTKRSIRITGTSPLGIPVDLNLNILKLTRHKLVYFYAEPYFTGAYISDHRPITLRRPKDDYSKKIIGTWEYKIEEKKFRMEFLDDAMYNFYVFDGQSWTVTPDSPHHYYLYGDFLVGHAVVEWNGIKRNHEHHHDNWNLEIKGDKMYLTALRGSDKIQLNIVAQKK